MVKSSQKSPTLVVENSVFTKITRPVPHLEQLIHIEEWLRQYQHLDTPQFCKSILNLLAEETQAYQAVFYIYDYEQRDYVATTQYGLVYEQLAIKSLKQETNILMEVTRLRKAKSFNTVGLGLTTTIGGLEISIANIVMIPLFFNQQVSGVIEFTYFTILEQQELQVLENALTKVAAVLNNLMEKQHNQYLYKQLQHQNDTLENAFTTLKATQAQLNEQKNATETAFSQYKEANSRLHESIKYARSIQKSILPNPERLLRLFAEYFVIYQAKDQVSGDFFWFSEKDFLGNKSFVMAVIDCTGHGVPGGFMSMIGNTLLHEIVNIKKESDPAHILSELHTGIREVLKQEQTKNHDGMEASICRFTKDKNKREFLVTFAGAKHDLYYRKNNQLLRIKGNRTFIGGGRLQKPTLTFDNQHITLKSNDLIYFCTDGLADTCNTRRQSYGRRRWENILEQCAPKKMYSQQYIIIKDLLNFKQQGEQRDDITCIGIRI